MKNYWLMKSEPSEFSIDDLAKLKGRPELWDGVRNYQARNMIRDQMRTGDLAFFYHSNCQEPGIVGIMEIVSGAYPDPTAFDSKDKHFDAKSDPGNPRWFVVDVIHNITFADPILLSELKQHPELAKMPLVRRGNRLSVMPVHAAEWKFILNLQSAG